MGLENKRPTAAPKENVVLLCPGLDWPCLISTKDAALDAFMKKTSEQPSTKQGFVEAKMASY